MLRPGAQPTPNIVTNLFLYHSVATAITTTPPAAIRLREHGGALNLPKWSASSADAVVAQRCRIVGRWSTTAAISPFGLTHLARGRRHCPLRSLGILAYRCPVTRPRDEANGGASGFPAGTGWDQIPDDWCSDRRKRMQDFEKIGVNLSERLQLRSCRYPMRLIR